MDVSRGRYHYPENQGEKVFKNDYHQPNDKKNMSAFIGDSSPETKPK